MSFKTLVDNVNNIMKEFPVCTIPCYDTQRTDACNLTIDVTTCLCKNIYWVTGNLVCIGQTCNATDAARFHDLFIQWCNASFVLTSHIASSSSIAQASASAAYSSYAGPSVKPESLVGIIFGGFIGCFLFLFGIVFLLLRCSDKNTLGKQRNNWEVDFVEMTVSDDASELQAPTASSTPYLLSQSTQSSTPPVPTKASCYMELVSSERVILATSSSSDGPQLEEVVTKQTAEAIRPRIPLHGPPPSYQSDRHVTLPSTSWQNASPGASSERTAIPGSSFLKL